MSRAPCNPGRRRKGTAAWVLVLLLLGSGALRTGTGEAAEVLTIRPERLVQPGASVPLLRDPFNWSREQIGQFRDREPVVKSNSAAGLTLTAILWEPTQAVAVINDRIVEVGDLIQGATILEIMKEMVIFELAGNYHTIWLEPTAVPLRTPGTKKGSR